MVDTGACAGTRTRPSQFGRRARSPGKEAARRAGGHRGRPQPQPGHAPEICGQWPDRGQGLKRGGAWRASRRLRPSPDLGDLLSRPAQVGQAGHPPSQPSGSLSQDCSGAAKTRGWSPDGQGPDPCCY
jgi:hypothetical protein